MLRPIGNQVEVIFDQSTDEPQPRLVSTLTPGASSAPGTTVPVVGVQGGTGFLALESSTRGEDAGSESQESVVPQAPGLVPLTALPITAPINSTTAIQIFGGGFTGFTVITAVKIIEGAWEADPDVTVTALVFVSSVEMTADLVVGSVAIGYQISLQEVTP